MRKRPQPEGSTAFSSEVDTASREENASKIEARTPFRFHRKGAPGQSSVKDDQERGPASQMAGWASFYESASTASRIKP
ncbi:hypothetical protein EAV90_24420 [Bradyrhizobium vignae]|nr:hypothetical protein EAV90_24420 [Bradyrhizobium vignae]